MLEKLAGKRQGNALAAVLNNLDTLEAAYQAAENSAGSAERENAKYQESIQYSLDRMKASIQELSVDLIGSDFLKGIIDGGNAAINVIDFLIDKIGTLNTLLLGLAGFGLFKSGGARVALGTLGVFTNNKWLNDFAKTDKQREAVTDVAESISSITRAFSESGFKGGVKALGSTVGSLVKAHPVLLGFGTAIATAALAANAIEKWVYSYDEKLSSAQKAIQEYSATKQEIESVNSELEETNARMLELRSKGSLTLVEKDELAKLEKSNAELERRQKILGVTEKTQSKAATTAVEKALTTKQRGDHFWENNWDVGYDPVSGAKNSQSIDVIEAIKRHADYLQELTKQREGYEEALASLSPDDKLRSLYENQIKELEAQEQEYTDFINEKLSDTDLFNEYTDLISDPALRNRLNEMYNAVDKAFGTSGASSQAKIEGTLAKYEDLKDILLDLAQQGELTSDTFAKGDGDISKFFKDITEKGVDIQDVVDYLQSLANPEAYNFDYLRKEFKGSLEDLGDEAVKFVDGLSEDELEAYAKIKAEDIDTSDWDIATWERELQDRIDEADVTVDIKAKPKLEEFTKALESPDAGANYETIQSNLENILNMRKEGLIGTDDFRTFTALISPNDIDTVKEYDKYISKIKRYFTEDNIGVGYFLHDLKNLKLATQEGNRLSVQIDDVANAADRMGVSTEVFVALCERLNDYGIFTGVYNNANEAKDAITDLYTEYNKLKAQQEVLEEAKAKGKATKADLTQLDAIKGKVNELREQIDQATDSYIGLLAGGETGDNLADAVDKAASDLSNAQSMALNVVEQWNQIDWKKYGENAGEVRQKILEGLKGLGNEAGGQFIVDAKGKISFQADTASATQAGKEAKETVEAVTKDTVIKVKTIVESGLGEKNADGSIDTIQPSNSTVFGQAVKRNQTVPKKIATSNSQTVKITADDTEFKEKYNQVTTDLKTLNTTTVSPTVEIKDSASTRINTISSALSTLNGTKAYVSIGFKTSTTPSNYNMTPKEGLAQASGSRGEPRDLTALAGEVGSELVVRKDKFFTIDYPQMFKFKKGDIIFNAEQTADILNGRKTTFGNALINGNARAASSGTGVNDVLAKVVKNPAAAKAAKDAEKAVKKTSKEAKDAAKSTANNNIYNWWQAYLDSASATLDNFQSQLDKLNSQYEDALEHGWDASARMIEEHIHQSSEKYSKNYMDTIQELKNKLQENFNALANLSPELKGKSIGDVVNNATLNMQIEKSFDDKLAATTDEKKKEDLQKDYDAYKSYYSSLVSIYNEISSMEENIKYVRDEYKTKAIEQAINLFDSGDASEVQKWADKYGYETAQAFVDAWHRQDPDLIGWLQKAVVDNGELDRLVAGIQHKIDDNEYSLDFLDDDSANSGQRVDILKQQQELQHQLANQYRDFGYDEDSDEIREAQQAWREAAVEIYEIERETAEARLEGLQDAIDDYDWLLGYAEEASPEAQTKYTLKALETEVDLYEDCQNQMAELNRQLENGAINVDQINEDLANLRDTQKDAIDAIIQYLQSLYDMQIQRIDDEIDEIKDKNDAIIDDLDEQIDDLEQQKDDLEDIADKYKQAAEAVKKTLKDEKELLEAEREQKEDYWSSRLEALEKSNEEQTRAYDLTQKQLALEQAQSQKNVAVFKDGRMTYESNYKDVHEAAQAVSEEKRKQQYERRKELLENERDTELDAVDARMKAVEDYQELWDTVFDKYTDELNEMSAAELMGSDWQDKILSHRTDTWEDFRDGYYNIESQIETYINSEIDRLNEAKEAQKKACDDQVAALERSKKALEDQQKAVDEFAVKFAEAFITGDQSVVNTYLQYVDNISLGTDNVIGNLDSMVAAAREAQAALEDAMASGGSTDAISTFKSIGTVASITNAYADGANYAKKGLGLVGENGAELVNFRGGEKVINHNDSVKFIDTIDKFNGMNPSEIMGRVPSLTQLMGGSVTGVPNSSFANDNSVHIGDINVEHTGANLDSFIDQIYTRMPSKVQQRSKRQQVK